MSNQGKYDFWRDEDPPGEVIKERPCLGTSPSCKKKVRGTASRRLCDPCRNMITYHMEGPNKPRKDRKKKREEPMRMTRPFERGLK